MTEPDYVVNISGLEEPARPVVVGLVGPSARGLVGRPWLGIRFDCCGVYQRVYRNREGTAYVGQCPRCLRRVRLRVGPKGTSARFFTAR